MTKTWYIFQEEIKSIFCDLGCDAQTNVRLQGVRTHHDVDILIRSKYLGQPLQWIIEAKHWSKKVSKLHVIALLKIVEETGTDKGFIISQKGFQSGALEAAEMSNVRLLTFDELAEVSKEVFHKDILKTYGRRLNYIVNRYYGHDKFIRIKYGLRHDTYDYNVQFSVHYILMAAAKVLRQAREHQYPIDTETHQKEKFGDHLVANFYQAVNWLNLNLIEAEERMLDAEVEMQKNQEFNPKLYNPDIEKNMQFNLVEAVARGSLRE